jgi:hypothetical protein
MSLHFISISCEECRLLFKVRSPNASRLIPAIVERVRCPACHPEALTDVCAACRLPFAIFKKTPGRGNVRKGLCFTCYQRVRRSQALHLQGRC